MKIAFLFPGQGAQYVGMGKDFYDSFSTARETFHEADEILYHAQEALTDSELLRLHQIDPFRRLCQFDNGAAHSDQFSFLSLGQSQSKFPAHGKGETLSKIIFEGPNERLKETQHAQLAIFVTSMAILRVIQEERPDLKPQVCAGLSLGEYTALCASGRLSFKETLLLVRERARLMNEACENTSGTMAAVLGLDSVGIVNAVKDLDGVWVANFNAPGQTVVSGTNEGIQNAGLLLKEKGAKKVIPLSVHGAFHSPLMLLAQEGLAPFVERVALEKSAIEFVMNVPGDFVSSVDEIRQNLICQVTQSVCWEQGIDSMKKADVDFFLEIGCGKTLSGLNKKMGITSMSSIDKITDLELAHAIT